MATYPTEHPFRSILGRRSVLIASLATLVTLVALAALVIAPPSEAKSTAVIKRAALSGSSTYPGVNGEAKWKAKDGDRELEVQIEDARRLAGKRLAVRIDGKLVGYMTVNSLGRARLAKSTELGQRVPVSVTGDAVRIRTAGGTLVASGRF